MSHEHGHAEDEHHEIYRILIGGALLIVAALLSHFLRLQWIPLILYVAAYLTLGGEVLIRAWKNLFCGEVFDENFLMSIATIGAFVIGEYPEAVGVMLFFQIGEYFEERAAGKSRKAIMDAVDMRPETVIRLTNGESQAVAAAEIAVGDMIEVRPGDRIPLDGVIVSGESLLDVSPITGEPMPVTVASGDRVVSGCINTQGLLTVRVENVLEDSMVSRILRSVETAAAGKPKVDRFITGFSRIYTPLVVAAAILTAVIPPLFFGGVWKDWIYSALTFLVISCPCALVLSVPLAFFSGIGAASKHGILCKSGATLEALASVRAVVMDKTGTLTKGEFSVQNCEPADGVSETALLALCAAAEHFSTHPIGISIRRGAAAQDITPKIPDNVQELAGCGIVAMIDGVQILCGNRRLMDRYGIVCPDAVSSKTEVLAASGTQYIGRILIGDAIKPDAAEAIGELQKARLHTVMLTGDSASAAYVADELNIRDIHTDLLPQDKVDCLQEVRQQYGAVLFVGDGINDAPVLANADVGAAMGSGTDAAIEVADIVYMRNEVGAIPRSLKIAKRAVKTARQNILLALLVKAAVLIPGFFGIANLWWAVLADTGVALLCVLNSVLVWRRS